MENLPANLSPTPAAQEATTTATTVVVDVTKGQSQDEKITAATSLLISAQDGSGNPGKLIIKATTDLTDIVGKGVKQGPTFTLDSKPHPDDVSKDVNYNEKESSSSSDSDDDLDYRDEKNVEHPLKKKINDLSPAAQTTFDDELDKNVRAIGGFNLLSEAYKLQPLEEKHVTELSTIKKNSIMICRIASKRISFIEGTIIKLNFEAKFLENFLKGYTGIMGYNYGMEFRLTQVRGNLYQAKQHLDKKNEPKILSEETPTTTSLNPKSEAERAAVTPRNLDLIDGDIYNLWIALVILKETVIVTNNAFLKENKETLSDLPKLTYKLQSDELNKLRTKCSTLTCEFHAHLNIVENNKDKPKDLSESQRLSDLSGKVRQIANKFTEITRLLNERKNSFKIQSTGSCRSITAIEDFSPECKKVIDLMKRIILLRENSQKFKSISQLKSSFEEEFKNLTEEKEEYSKNTLQKRKKEIESAIDTYKFYITSMKDKMTIVKGPLEVLTKHYQQKEKSALEEIKKLQAIKDKQNNELLKKQLADQAEKERITKTSSGQTSSWSFSWFRGPDSPSSPKAGPDEKTTASRNKSGEKSENTESEKDKETKNPTEEEPQWREEDVDQKETGSEKDTASQNQNRTATAEEEPQWHRDADENKEGNKDKES